MSIRSVPFVPGEFYHLYNRGNSKQEIFHDEQDYIFFIKLLYILNHSVNTRVAELVDLGFDIPINNKLVSIGAYVLMPNHFHILVTPTQVGDISKFMQKVCTAYVMYYNKKYERTGSLFEGKFKSKHLDTENYFKYIFAYIHLNPVKLIDSKWKENGITNKPKAMTYLENYKYSSFLDYLHPNTRSQAKVLSIEEYKDYCPTSSEFTKDIINWLSFKEEI